MRKLKTQIGIDIDGVVAAFSDRYRELSLKYFNLPVPSDAPQLRWEHDWLTREQNDFIWRRIDETANFWETLGKEKGTELLRDAQRYFQLYFITTRDKTAGRSVEQQSMRWLRNNYAIEFPQVIVTDEKGDAARVLQLSAFIDDRPSNLRDIERGSPETKLFIRDQTYNREMKDSNVTRVATLDAMLEGLN